MDKLWLSIISIALIFISLVLTLVGVYKDIVPKKKIPSWLIFSTLLRRQKRDYIAIAP